MFACIIFVFHVRGGVASIRLRPTPPDTPTAYILALNRSRSQAVGRSDRSQIVDKSKGDCSCMPRARKSAEDQNSKVGRVSPGIADRSLVHQSRLGEFW